MNYRRLDVDREARPESPHRRRLGGPAGWARGAALAVMGACGDPGEDAAARAELSGEELFALPFPGGNGRSCATCHVPTDDFTLKPDHVQQLWQTDPDDPLFAAIDADDPDAETLTYEHLKRGLVRVRLTVPDNVDILDDAGAVVTPPDRRLAVWRSVPSIADTAMSAPYQLDGRMATLEEQARAAIDGHSGGGDATTDELARIAAFQRDVFTSGRARAAAQHLADGVDAVDVPDVDDALHLAPAEQRGRLVFAAACAACHGGPDKTTITDRAVHARLFPALRPDGTVQYEVPATDPPTPVLVDLPDSEFLNIGSAFVTYLGQVDTESEIFTRDVEFPRYRYRFYTDGTRREKLVDLPPPPPPFAGDDLSDFGPEFDDDGNPVAGPNGVPQLFSADPGRAMITGRPGDFEAFDVPTLRGIARTAPYFHDNSAGELHGVVNFYSQFVLGRFPSLGLPPVHPPDHADGQPESLTAAQKSDLIAFLNRL